MRQINVDVFVVGAGPTGLAAAALLAKLNVKALTITRYSGLANSPRAHIINQRAMEVFRDLGIEDRIKATAMPNRLMGRTIWATSFVGQELARCWSWGEGPLRRSDYESASPTEMCNIHQHLFEPIMCKAAQEFGADILFSTDLISMRQTDAAVHSICRDRVTGEEIEIISKYAIGADGDNSTVCKEIGFEIEGQVDLGHNIEFWLEMDLSKYTEYRPGALYSIIQPGGHFWSGSATFICIRTFNEWSMSEPYDPALGFPDVSEEAVANRARKLIGDDSIPIKLVRYSKWSISQAVAKTMRKDRVFIAGNAAHRHPPANGLGANTCIQDAFNLCWKLAMVLNGKAGDALLDSYEQERKPVGDQVVKRAMDSVINLGALMQAFGLYPGQSEEEGWEAIRELSSASEVGTSRRAHLEKTIDLQDYCFNTHGVELGQMYASNAVVPDGSQFTPERDPELYHTKTTMPGAPLPHAWLETNHEIISTLDLVGHGEFALLTGVGGDMWIEAGHALASEFGIAINVKRIGPSLDAQDIYGEWRNVREMRENGCLLVRPDRHIAFRAMEKSDQASDILRAALQQILGLSA